MIKYFWRNLLTIILAITCFFSYVPTTVFASEFATNKDSNTDISLDEYFERKYVVTLSDNITGDTISHEVYSTSDSNIISEEFINTYLNENYSLDNIEIIDLGPTNLNSDYDDIQPYAVETLFDIGCLILSASEFYNNPSVWNGMQVIIDGDSVILPFVPALSGVKRMIKASDKLQDSLEYGIKTYGDLRKTISGTGLEAHHIMPQKFKDLFGLNANDMFCIALKKSDHTKITTKFNSAKYGLTDAASTYTKSEVKRKMIKIYDDLYDETGDELFEFLSKFISENSQYGIN